MRHIKRQEHTENWDVSMLPEVSVNQKRLNAREHTVMMAPSSFFR